MLALAWANACVEGDSPTGPPPVRKCYEVLVVDSTGNVERRRYGPEGLFPRCWDDDDDDDKGLEP